MWLTWKLSIYKQFCCSNAWSSLLVPCYEPCCLGGFEIVTRQAEYQNIALSCRISWKIQKSILTKYLSRHLFLTLPKWVHHFPLTPMCSTWPMFLQNSQKWSISNFSCNLTRNITSHSMEKLTFYILLTWKIDYTTNSHQLNLYISLKRFGRMYFLSLGMK